MKFNLLSKTFNKIKLLLKSVVVNYDELIRRMKSKETITEIMGDTEQTNQSKQGFPCPECNSVTPITMEILIFNQPIFCSGCGTKFSLVNEESKTVIEDLKKVYQAQNELKEIKGVKTN